MNRLLVCLLSAFDAVLAVAVGIAVVLAPLTVIWVIGFGGTADWGALWPATASVWQLGHLVPLAITLPGDYLAATRLDEDAASFALSLAPLAFTVFTAVFAARSGVRSSRASAWITGVAGGTAAFALAAAAVALTAANPVAQPVRWEAIVYPTLVFALPALAGAVVTEWQEAPSGAIARLRERAAGWPHRWGEVPGLALRAMAVVVIGLIGLGALGFVVALVFGGAEVIALFETGHMDVLGVTVTMLAQLAYLPTIVIWCLAFVAGPGFALGAGTAVSPAGTQLGVVPGIPVFGAIPVDTSPWLLLLALLPVALGALAGWIVRSRLVVRDVASADAPVARETVPPAPAWATPALEDVLGAPPAEPDPVADADGPIVVRLTLTAAIAVLSGAAAALLAFLAGGSIGPGSLASVGPAPGPLALAVGMEVFIGAAILILAPRRRHRTEAESSEPDEPSARADEPTPGDASVPGEPDSDARDTTPLPPLMPPPEGTTPDGPTPRRPRPLPG